MICRCKNCGSAAKFDPSKNKMICSYCDSVFDPDESQQREYIEYNVYACSSCGGELRINGVEASTFCPYCGQPTIAYSRVSKEVQPDVIIPFSVTREEAVEIVRNKLKRNIFVPRQIRNFDVDRIRGIYIPFWLFDAKYTGRAILKTQHGSSKHKVYYYHYRHGECDFKNITADASKRLIDESSQRLEPYDVSKAVPFQLNYLSGFYADRYDVEDEEVESIVKARARKYYEDELLTTVSGSDKRIIESKDSIVLSEARYAFLPVWFLTFRYKDNPYTFLINGQTSKVIGGVPYVKAIAATLWTVLCAALLYPANWLVNFFWSYEKPVQSFIVDAFVISFIAAFGLGRFADLKKARELTTSKEIKHMVSDREEEH